MTAAQAQTAPASSSASDADQHEIVVQADRVGLLETQPSQLVFGLAKPLVETPRAATIASDTTLARYGIHNVTDLVAVSPGAGTASWYGIPGSVNLRGSMSDNYYEGFQRIVNYGTYATPLGGASSVEILRGPPSAVYGAGKVGGLVNYTPKSGFNGDGTIINKWSGNFTITGGSYDKKNATAELNAPITLGGVRGGLSTYVEVDDSHSYYIGMKPKYQLYQVGAGFDLGNGFGIKGSAMVYHSTGYIQTFQNRLTQALVDNGTYTTGRDTSVIDADGNGSLTPNEATPKSFHVTWNGVTPAPTSARSTLDVGVGTTIISPRVVSYSAYDFNYTTTQTYNADVFKDFGGGQKITLSYFMDKLRNDRFFSYGFPAHYRANAQEVRLAYALPIKPSDDLTINTVFGTSYRWVAATKGESYLGGFVSVDRRDLSYGASPTDIFNDANTFETYVHSNTSEAAAFGVVDTMYKRFDLLLTGRYDHYGVTSSDSGSIVYAPVVAGQAYTAQSGKWTYSASLSYKTKLGFIPYITHAFSSSLELNQASDIQPGQVYNNDWLSNSTLTEGGIKFELLHGHLVGALDAYDQRRRRNDPMTNSSVQTWSQGLEFEFRYVVNKTLSLNGSANRQRTLILGDSTTTYLPCYEVGLSGANCYGVNYRIGYNALYPGLRYDYSVIPKTIASLFANLTSDKHAWGEYGATLGVVYTGPTHTLVPVNPVYFHDHTLVNYSMFYTKDRYTISGNITNLFNKRYYQPATDTTANVVAIPGIGREWRISFSAKL